MHVFERRGTHRLVDIAMETQMVTSKKEFIRLVAQGAVTWNGELVNIATLPIETKGILKVGKRRFLTIQ